MSIFKQIYLFTLIILLYPFSEPQAQPTRDDSDFYQAAVSNATEVYSQSAKSRSRLYNGRKYKPYRIAFINGTPFFLSDQFTAGSVVYEGGFYKDVKLLYDQVEDRLIFKAEVAIELINERVEQFAINDHLFRRLIKDSLNTGFKTGFYEQLYKGKIEIYKKERKLIKENLSSTEGIRGEIDKKTFYYLKKNGSYYLIKKGNSLFEALGDHKSEIQHFISSNNLSLKKDKENTLTKIAAFYDQLTK